MLPDPGTAALAGYPAACSTRGVSKGSESLWEEVLRRYRRIASYRDRVRLHVETAHGRCVLCECSIEFERRSPEPSSYLDLDLTTGRGVHFRVRNDGDHTTHWVESEAVGAREPSDRRDLPSVIGWHRTMLHELPFHVLSLLMPNALPWLPREARPSAVGEVRDDAALCVLHLERYDLCLEVGPDGLVRTMATTNLPPQSIDPLVGLEIEAKLTEAELGERDWASRVYLELEPQAAS